MEEENNIELTFHKNQLDIFYNSKARYKIIAKGRRFGLTKGMANYIIDRMLTSKIAVLWVDTTYSNIQRYVERYIIPELNNLPNNEWKWRKKESILELGMSYCDFRSADRPENIEGFGYNLIILNEAGIILKNNRLWLESIRPMVMDYKAEVIIGGTPKGKRVKNNETHYFYELSEYAKKTKGWKFYNYSSYDNVLIEADEIDELVKEMSPALRGQEIYGKFVDVETEGIIKIKWFNFYENESEIFRKKIFKRVQSWDTAFKSKQENDYSVCTTWIVTENKYYLVNVWRGRAEFPELKRKVIELYEKHLPNEILIEDKASGQSLIQELRSNTRMPIKPIKVDIDKIARVHSITPVIETGKVSLYNQAEWLKDFLAECEDFPNCEFDDQIDSMSQFLNYMRNGMSIGIPKIITRKVIRKVRG